VRADLRHHYCGFSLRSLFDGEVTPDEVWDMVTHLPRNCATWSAVYADPDTPLSDEVREMPLSEYSPEVEALHDCYDMLASLAAQVRAIASGESQQVKPHRRPLEGKRAALRAARREQARQEWDELLTQMGIER
jgi:hypothetical protein